MPGKLRYLSLAFVEFTTAGGKVVLFDPWTKTDGNPHCPAAIAVPFEEPREETAELVGTY